MGTVLYHVHVTELKPTAVMRCAMDGPHVGVGVCYGLEDEEVAFEAQCSWVRPGNCKLIATGGIGDVLKRCADVTYIIVRSLACSINKRLTELSYPPVDLIKTGYDIHMHLVCQSSKEVSHGLYKAAMAMSLLSLMMRRRPRQGVGIVGDVMPSGRISMYSSDWTLVTVDRCEFFRVRRIIIPKEVELSPEVLDRAAIPAADGQPTLVFIRHESLWDAIEDVF